MDAGADKPGNPAYSAGNYKENVELFLIGYKMYFSGFGACYIFWKIGWKLKKKEISTFVC